MANTFDVVAVDEVQKLTDEHVRRIDQMAQEKEREIMDVG